MADALVSEASVARHEGSTPSSRTIFLANDFVSIFCNNPCML